MSPVAPEPKRREDKVAAAQPADWGGAEAEDEAAEARLFYERLEQTGQLVAVDARTDVGALPPHVTHVRYPDGRVERVGFSAGP